MCSFRGLEKDRGNGTERVSSDEGGMGFPGMGGLGGFGF